MARDAATMRGARPVQFTNLRTGEGVAEIVAFLARAGGLSPDGEALNAP
jgi:urease accessory protein